MSVVLIGLRCFVLAVAFGIAPVAVGAGIGWILCTEKMIKTITTLKDEGDITVEEANILLDVLHIKKT